MMSTRQSRRKRLRLPHYDYVNAGAYFVTVCTRDRACIFGAVVEAAMQLSDAGEIARDAWLDLPNHYAGVGLDEFVVMPNHVHGVIVFEETNRAALSEVLRAFKSFSSRRINERRAAPGTAVWQRSYYEHVIRNDADLASIREYIQNNPAQWALDRENPLRAEASVGAGSSFDSRPRPHPELPHPERAGHTLRQAQDEAGAAKDEG